MKIVITGGGTGGHIYPALSIARHLKEQGAELLYVGSQHGPEGKLAEQEGLRFVAVPSGPIVGLTSPRTLVSICKLGLGVIKAYFLLRKFRPDVLIGTGGYTSAGVALAERIRGGKIVIHEQNSIPGRTNRMLAKLARKVCVTFQESEEYFPAGKTVLTGLPVRSEILHGVDKRAARENLGLDPDKFTLLVFGGSQGARRINNMIIDAVPALIDAGLQVIHQSGKNNYEDVTAKRPDLPGYKVFPYINNMAEAYSAADLVVSRSGASSIAEITAVGLPAVFIPFPFAQADHQTKNAEAVSRAGAALVLEEKSIDSSALTSIILDLTADNARLDAMAQASKKLGRPNAAEEIVKVIQHVAAS